MNKEKIMAIIIGAILALFVSLIVINGFFMQYFLTFRSPLIIQSPIQVHKREMLKPVMVTPTPRKVTATPTPTIKHKRVELLHQEIYAKVSMLESSGGKPVGLNKRCIEQGKVNTIGYAPHIKYCFNTIEDEMRVFGKWFQDKFNKGLTTAQALCLWNTGKSITSCDYVVAYNSL